MDNKILETKKKIIDQRVFTFGKLFNDIKKVSKNATIDRNSKYDFFEALANFETKDQTFFKK